ncbi:hypothetical protein Rsub_10974 [Raphidocelis subcapitata]|uniref:Uncharacterized protein n=1 Tax=Raphidocelis subcapitata TaxID=307507 RepID=A0A2V0PEM4_9CHLO|nr:hypothetical protein Rsub_10974 [Raphidocelis subcapitata]|eukprot:GBF98311.1 hypothetical protein Rsub_10974 [Raphidocelis subcapitata]
MGQATSTALAAPDRDRGGDNRPWEQDHTLSGPWNFLLKEHVQCICEGGRACNKEDPSRQAGPPAPFAGLHCSWVAGGVLAMARPWQENLEKHDVLRQFREQGVGMVINLQEVGEHAECGPGNLPGSGFTYRPEYFMAGGIGFVNISWRDMGVPTLDRMLDLVQVMHHCTAVEGRRLALHCHAGLGRTGLAAACFLLYAGHAPSAAAAVAAVRAARPGALQTAAQVLFVSIFEQYLQHLRCVFRAVDPSKHFLGRESFFAARASRALTRTRSTSGSGSLPTASEAAAAAAALVAAAAAAAAAGGGKGDAAAAAAALGCAATILPDSPPAASAGAGAAPSAAAADAAANAAGNGSGGVALPPLVLHAQRLSGGGGSMKIVSSPASAPAAASDAPLHVISTDLAVTEARAAPGEAELGLDAALPWTEKFQIRPESFSPEGFAPEPPSTYSEALRRQSRVLHGVERRQSSRMHRLVKAAVRALAAGVPQYEAAAAAERLALGAAARAADRRSSDGGGGGGGGGGARQAVAVTAAAAAPARAALAGYGQMLQRRLSGRGERDAAGGTAGAGAAAGGGGAPTAVPPRRLSDLHQLSRPPTPPSRRRSTAARDGGAPPTSVPGAGPPSFAGAALACLQAKGRIPDNKRQCWGGLRCVAEFGLGEDGQALADALGQLKLQANAGDYSGLARARPALVLLLLEAWFTSFQCECLCEPTLEVLIDEAEDLMAQEEDLRAAKESHGAGSSSGGGSGSGSSSSSGGSDSDPSFGSGAGGGVLVRRAARGLVSQLRRHAGCRVRAVCRALAAHEQDLFLAFAAALRVARASGRAADDAAAAAAQAGEPRHTVVTVAGGGQEPWQGAQPPSLPAAAPAGGELSGHDAVVRSLCDAFAGWLVHPLGAACPPAHQAAAAFLWFLVREDAGYRCLLHAKRQQGMRRAHSEHSNLSRSPRAALRLAASPAASPRGARSGSGSGAGKVPPSRQLEAAAALGAAKQHEQQEQEQRRQQRQRRGQGAAAGDEAHPESDGHVGSLKVGRRIGSAGGTRLAVGDTAAAGLHEAAAAAAARGGRPQPAPPAAGPRHSRGGTRAAVPALPLALKHAAAGRGDRRRSAGGGGAPAGAPRRGGAPGAPRRPASPQAAWLEPGGGSGAVIAPDPTALSISALSELQLAPASTSRTATTGASASEDGGGGGGGGGGRAAGPRESQSLEGFGA